MTAAAPDATRLRALLAADDPDAALEAGLMAFAPGPEDGDLAEAQARFTVAWAAKARFDARNARLARRQAVRDASRASRAAPADATTEVAAASTSTVAPVPSTPRPALPPAAAAALARARARATGTP